MIIFYIKLIYVYMYIYKTYTTYIYIYIYKFWLLQKRYAKLVVTKNFLFFIVPIYIIYAVYQLFHLTRY